MNEMEVFDPTAQVEVKEIVVTGNDRTKLAFFDAEFSKSVADSKNLGELYVNMSRITNGLLESNLFDVVDTNISIDSFTSKGNKYFSVLKVHVKEKGIPTLKLQTYVTAGGSSNAGVELQGALRNPTGHGEMFRLASKTNQAGNKEFTASLTVPNVGNQHGTLDISARSGEDSANSHFTSFKEAVNAVTANYTTRCNKHKVSLEYALRDEVPVTFTTTASGAAASTGTDGTTAAVTGTRFASAAVLGTAGSSVKTSLKYDFTPVDTRDSSCNPSKGHYVHGSVELALPPGTAQFVKTELSTQLHTTFGAKTASPFGVPGLVGSIIGNVGVMLPLNKVLPMFATTNGNRGGSESFLSDRYHLGGALSLRGFENCGVGARAYAQGNTTDAVTGTANKTGVETNSLGGDTKASLLALLSIPVPIPSVASANVRAFLFANAGSLGPCSYWAKSGSANASSTPFFGYLRASVGGGLSIALNNQVRLETTYSVPVVKARQDSVRGFQIGLGLSIN